MTKTTEKKLTDAAKREARKAKYSAKISSFRPWVKVYEEMELECLICSFHERMDERGKPNNYYVVRLLDECECTQQTLPITVDAGQAVNLGEMAGLMVLKTMMNAEVFITVNEKKTLGGGKSMWDFNIQMDPGSTDGVIPD